MSFDVLAPHYRWMEFFLAGEKLQRCRTAFLDHVAGAQSILILGEGHGRFLVQCRRRAPHARITCLDASAAMLEVARERLQRAGLPLENISFIHADALTWRGSDQSADLIVTHFFLDCFRPDQLELLIANLSRIARPDAAWLIADFHEPASGLSRFRARLILKTMYVFFRRVTRLPATRLTTPDAFLQRNGFKLQHRRQTEWGLLHSDLWQRDGDRTA